MSWTSGFLPVDVFNDKQSIKTFSGCSMHDNRWEGEKEVKEREEEDGSKREEKKQEEKPKPATAQKVETTARTST